METKLSKRVLAFLLVLIMLFTTLPLSVFAQEGVVSSAGKDTTNDTSYPGVIEDEDDLIEFPLTFKDVDTAEKLESAINEGIDAIRITADFEIDRTFFITDNTIIYCESAVTLTRSATFAGDVFVVGQNSDGTLCEEGVVFSLGGAANNDTGVLTIDGNKDNMTVDVVGTVVFVCTGAQADLYENLVITNNKKVGNERALDTLHGLTNTKYIGGAIAILSASSVMNIYGGTYSNSSVNTSGNSVYGGAFYNYATLNIYGGTIENNSAVRAGAIYNYRTARIYNAVIQNNTASTYGGAIYSPASTAAKLYFGGENDICESSVLVKGNTATSGGGAVYCAGPVVAVDTTFEANSSENGGAFYASSKYGTMEFDSCDFIGNSATEGGGVVSTSGHTTLKKDVDLTIKNSTFTGNTAANGGVAKLGELNVTSIENSVFKENTTTSTGGVLHVTSATVTINNVELDSNTASSGIIYATYVADEETQENILSSITINKLNAEGNAVTGNGGVIYAVQTNLDVYNSVFKSNNAKAGSVMYLYTGVTVNIYASSFIGNACDESNTGNAAALFIYTGGTPALVHSCTFVGNTSAGLGGAMTISNKTVAHLYNITAIDNSALKGGVLYETSAGTVITISGLTVSGNTATGGGSIIWGNTANAKLYINKDNHVDLDIEGALPSDYWTSAIANKLTTYDSDAQIPSYVDFGGETISDIWTAVIVKNLDELEAAILAKAPVIRIASDIYVDRTLYINYDAHIFSTTSCTIYRAEGFTDRVFVVGNVTEPEVSEDAEATEPAEPVIVPVSAILGGKTSGAEDLLIFDGGNACVESAIELLSGATLDVYKNVTITNTVTTKGAFNVNSGSTLNFNDGTVKSNVSGDDINSYGLIYNFGTVNIFGGTFADNVSKYGGVIYNRGVLNISGGSFDGNTGLRGGVIYNRATLNITGGEFNNNTATENGGVILGYAGDIVLGGSFNGNSAVNGGVVYLVDGTCSVNGSFNGNKADENGGVIYMGENVAVIVENATFTENEAIAGGAICIESNTLSISASAFNGNKASLGGAIYSNGTRRLALKDVNANGNIAVENGGFLYSRASVVVSNISTVANNDADLGGGFYLVNSSCQLNANTFNANSATEGGAIYCDGATIKSNGDTYTSNSADFNAGAVLLLGSKGYFNKVDALTNSASNDGGFVYAQSSSLDIRYSSLKANTADMNGGAVAVGEGAEAGIYQSSLISNSASRNGGAVSSSASEAKVTIQLCTLEGNNADTFGGAIFASNKSEFYLYSNTVSSGSALRGGFLYVTDKDTAVTIIDITLSGNTATNGPIAYGNDADAYVYLNKELYTDASTSNLNSTYFAKAFTGKLTLKAIYDEAPEYKELGDDTSNETIGSYVDVSNAEQLQVAIDNQEKYIRIVADFELDRTYYITYNVVIFSTSRHTLTRASDFGGDIFVIGEHSDGTSAMPETPDSCLTIGNPESSANNMLIIDGNRENMTVDVAGTVFFICNSAKVNLYSGFTVVNCYKTSNEKTYGEGYGLSRPNRIGGALAIISLGTLNIYGGIYENNASRDESDSSEDGRLSSIGGLIYNESNLRIYDGLFKNNSGARGGVVYNYAMVKIYGGSFIGNRSSVAGGVYYSPSSAASHLNIGFESDSTILFKENIAETSGSVIYASYLAGVVIHGNTVFENNVARTNNGGVICVSGMLTVRNSSFIGNTAAARGGAIFLSRGSDNTVTRLSKIENCTFIGNKAGTGGALSLYSGDSEYDGGASTTVVNSEFISNSASTGGAVSVERISDLTIKGSRFEGNSSTSEAGAIYTITEGTINIYDSAFVSNTAGNHGGAFSIRSCYFNIYNSTVEGNHTSKNGGAFYISYSSACEINSSVNIVNTTVKGNSSEGSGGAIYSTRRAIEGDTEILTIKSSDFAQNSAVTAGGAILLTGSADTYMSDVSFVSNTVTDTGDGYGGAIAVWSGTLEIDGAVFTKNSSLKSGGAIYFESSSASLKLNSITATKNTARVSGGFAFGIEGEMKLYNSTLKGNSANTGGAVYLYDGAKGGIYNTDFKDNTSSDNGGALFIYTFGQSVNVHDCSFEGNNAGNSGGAAYISGESIVGLYNTVARSNSADKGGFMYETKAGTIVYLSGLELSGNTAISGGDIIWGNTKNADLFIDKSTVTDLDVGALDESYWDSFVANLLTVESSAVSVPTYKDYTIVIDKAVTVTVKTPVSVNDVFNLGINSSDGFINSTYDKFPVLDNSSNFMSIDQTFFENINGETVTVDTYVYQNYATNGNMNVGQGLMIYQAMLYKQANPDEDVYIDIASYRFSVQTAVNINRNSRYFGYVRQLPQGKNYDEFGFVRISYLLVSAAKMGIHVNVMGHSDGYPLTSNERLATYFVNFLKDPCDPDYVKDGVIGDYMTFTKFPWTLGGSGGKGGTDMMHVKLCAVSHYLDMNGQVHKNAVWTSSSNLDGVYSGGYNANWKLQTATIISDHEAIYNVAVNYLRLLPKYSDQEGIVEFQNYINVKSTEQIDLILAGRGEEIPVSERIVYVGTENDDVFEFYFTPFAGETLVWNEKYSPHSKYLRELYNSEDYIIFTWNAAEYSGGFMLGQQIEQMIIEAFHKNKNPNNKIYANMESFDPSTFDDLVVGTDIGYKSINEWKFGAVHNKDLQFSYVKNGTRYYVSLLNSCNFHSGSMYYQPNFALVIKETSCASNSVFSIVSEYSTTGNLVSHTFGDTQIQPPTRNEHGYKYAICEICGERENLEVLHYGSEWVEDKLPANGECGIRHKNCTVCGELLETQEFLIAGSQFVLELDKWLGMTFDTKSAVSVDVNGTPHTFEATLQIPTTHTARGGVIFSNYGIDPDNAISLEIYTGGRVRLFFVNQGMKVDCIFSTDIRSADKTNIAVTVDGTSASLYVNGELCETKSLGCSLPSLTNDFQIGGDHRSANAQYFKGTLYAVNLFADVRTAEEIKEDSIVVTPSAQSLIYSNYFTKDGGNAIVGADKLMSSTESFEVDKTLTSTPSTLEAVIYVPSSFAGDIGLIVGNYINNNNAISLEAVSGGLLKLIIVNNGNKLEYTFSTDIRSSMPTHLAVTMSNGIASLYVNGQLTEELAITTVLPNATEGYYISGTRAKAFGGAVYAVNLFGDVRTPEEIKQDMILVRSDADNLLYSAYFTEDGCATEIYGQTFSNEIMGSVGCTDGTPATFEAVVQVPVDMTDRAGIIFSNYGTDSDSPVYLEVAQNGKLRLYFVKDDTVVNCYFTTDIRSNDPVHIAVTMTKGTARLYVNGVHKETKGLAKSLPLTIENITIGGDLRNGNEQYFKGTIYSVALFDHARSAEQVARDAIFVQPDAQGLIYSGTYAKPNGNMISEGELHSNLLYVIDKAETETDIGLAHYECALCGKITKYVSIKSGVEIINKNDYANPSAGVKPDEIFKLDSKFDSVPLTYEAMIQLSPTFNDRAGVVMGNYDAGTSNQVNIEIYNKGTPRLYYKVGYVGYSYVFKTDIRSDKLTHIAITVDGLNAHLYVNGEWAETVALTVAFPGTSPLPFCIGADNRAKSPQLFAGTIYSAAMFADVRTAEEIKNDAIMVSSNADNLLFNKFFLDAEDAEIKGIWNGSSAVFVGDSITYGAGCDGDTYWEILRDSLGLSSATGMGVGGSCISQTSNYGSNHNPLVNRFDTIPEADLISIFMGTNDYGHDTPLGTIDDTTDVSFYGALNVIIPQLLEKNPDATIVFITPLHRYGYGTNNGTGQPHTYDSVPNGAGHTLEEYANAIVEVCGKYGVHVIDLFNLCDLDPSIELTREMYMEDGLHPNAIGHKYIATILEHWFVEIGKSVAE
ncbi:MAG: hypothetical protein J6B34_03515 [Clostridia bacterium]|nr:hypothetical protein [Clostridia bacterium]